MPVADPREAAAASVQYPRNDIPALVIGGAVVVIGGLAWWFSRSVTAPSPPVFDEPAAIAYGQEKVRAVLKDGASAEFRSSRVSHYNNAPLICGEVNAKNSLGGYGGFQRFIYAGRSLGVVLEENMAAGEMDKTWSEFCRG